MRILLTDLYNKARFRPDGYIDDVLSFAKIDGNFYEISREDHSRLREKYRLSPTKIANAVQAITTAKEVSLEIFEERTKTCGTCDKAKLIDDKRYCGVCGCSVMPDFKQIINLAKVEENLPKWGCKHPEREAGKGWKQ